MATMYVRKSRLAPRQQSKLIEEKRGPKKNGGSVLFKSSRNIFAWSAHPAFAGVSFSAGSDRALCHR